MNDKTGPLSTAAQRPACSSPPTVLPIPPTAPFLRLLLLDQAQAQELVNVICAPPEHEFRFWFVACSRVVDREPPPAPRTVAFLTASASNCGVPDLPLPAHP